MAEAMLATISVPPKKGKARSRPRHLIAGTGYDSRTFRQSLHTVTTHSQCTQSLHAPGIRPCIAPKRRPLTGSHAGVVPSSSTPKSIGGAGR
jgi:hypothetical protein